MGLPLSLGKVSGSRKQVTLLSFEVCEGGREGCSHGLDDGTAWDAGANSPEIIKPETF